MSENESVGITPDRCFFSCLERAMQKVIKPIGNFSHQKFRAFNADQRHHPSHGFIDGDLAESFLDLEKSTMDKVVKEMNRDGGWDIDDSHLHTRNGKAESDVNNDSGLHEDMELQRYTLSVEDVLAMVEEMTMMH